MQRIALVLTALALFIAPSAPAHAAPPAKKIVIIAGNDSHGSGAHVWGAGSELLASILNNESGLPVKAEVHKRWPQDPASAFKDAATIVILCDGGGGHVAIPHLKELDPIMDSGVGLVCVHYAVEVPKGEAGNRFLKWMGGYFEMNWSVNPHWRAVYKSLPDHPVANGVKPFELDDEWYYHMRFQPDMKGVTPILSTLPPKETLSRGDGPHSGNPDVRKAVLERNEPQHMAWAYQRPKSDGGGRGFGITGAHNHKSWDNDSFRTVVLNAIVWTAGLDVPTSGVKSLPNPTIRFSDTVPVAARAQSLPAQGATIKDAAFASKVVSSSTPNHSVEISADIKGAKQLFLVVTDGGDGFGCDWADWAEPRLVDSGGKETKLTDVKWKSASSQWGQVLVGSNAGGRPMKIAGKPVAYGIGTHANSIITYDLPANHNFVAFKAIGGVDNGGTDQGCGSSVQFAVFTKTPSSAILAASAGAAGGASGSHDPEDAVAGLDVHEDLQVDLFAAEPMLMNPSNIDIDHRGRVWVAEIVNYRGKKGTRPEGDRIIIIEDKDHDGKADDVKTFYQAPDFNSPHGVTVLATPDGKNTKVIVAIGDKVLVMTDKDGDDKADSVDTLFSGISGTQHDHGIHQFIFGPDGKLYFNYGNSGNQIKDKDGKPITDKAGNVVAAHGKPYRQGMVFRCNLDGSEFETLGWNFRNNWMVTVDSFGTLWQSDNDDDGNRGVRINYVMEFGNYGYQQEMTGAGWGNNWKKGQAKGAKEEDKVLYEWHQHDPGVVPNLLHTGAGSPTGICVYEASLLPKVFRGQMIHCDAGPNVVRAYPVISDGAGYKADIVNVLQGARDKWFRPSDVKVAPDGSLIVADWYDPGVGGHAAGDLNRGRLFRVTPKGHKGYDVPKVDFSTADSCVEALKSPTPSVRYVAWQALHEMGAKAEPALKKVWDDKSAQERKRARVLWLLGKISGKGDEYVAAAIKDANPNIRITGVRLARELSNVDMLAIVKSLVKDPSPQVRRECAIAIRHTTTPDAAALWAELAAQHDGKDRWYLEALGLASDLHADECFDAYLKKVADPTTSAAGHDIVWRVRAKAALPMIAKILTNKDTPAAERDRYVNALDFHPKSLEKDKAMQAILGL